LNLGRLVTPELMWYEGSGHPARPSLVYRLALDIGFGANLLAFAIPNVSLDEVGLIRI
jgi:hypothetical protein